MNPSPSMDWYSLFARSLSYSRPACSRWPTKWGDTRHQGVELGFYFFWDVKPYMAFMGHQKIIYDIASGLNVKYKFTGLRAGYRYIKVDSQNLRGPEIGLFIQF